MESQNQPTKSPKYSQKEKGVYTQQEVNKEWQVKYYQKE